MAMPTGMRGMTQMGDPGKRKARLERRQARKQTRINEANSRMAARVAEKHMKEGKDKPEECTKDGCSAYDTQKKPGESTGKMLKDTKLVKGIKRVAKGIGEALQPNAPKLRGTSARAKRRYAKRAHEYYEKISKRENRKNQRISTRTARKEDKAQKRDVRIAERGERKVARIQNRIERINARSQNKKRGPKKSKGEF